MAAPMRGGLCWSVVAIQIYLTLDLLRSKQPAPAPSSSAAWGGDACEDHLRSMAAT